MGLTNRMKNISRIQNQRGAVSLFVVIFAMLIMTVLVVSFLRLMMSDQNQATSANLAEGARNSAMAGVEDAKRALLRYGEYCKSHSQAECDELATRLASDTCNLAVRIGDVVADDAQSGGSDTQPGEIKVQQTQNSGDALLDQAYTCVTMELNTDDYIGSIGVNSTQIVPLIGTSDFDRVTIEWFSREDLGATSSSNLSLQSTASRVMTSDWPANRPSVLRAQFMQFGDSFTLSDFDSTTNSGESNANTLFLYPTSNGTQAPQSLTARDQRRAPSQEESPSDSSSDTPLGVRCQSSLSSGGYACSVTIVLPNPVGGGDRTAFLRLVPYYNSTHFRVTMSDGSASNIVQFDAVQPEVDSTGRANNVFKRMSARVDLYNIGSIVPGAAVDVTGSFCKDFSVTDNRYVAGTCTP